MGHKKLLIKLAEFFNMDARERDQQKEDLHVLLKRLKNKEVKLQEELELESDPEVKGKICQKIELVHTQRKKGVKMCKELKKQSQDKVEEKE